MSSSVLAEELADLQEKIGQVRGKQKALEEELRALEPGLARLSADRPKFAAVRDVCAALGRLEELKAEDLFWEDAADLRQAAGYVERARGRVASFEGELSAVLEQQASLREQIDRCVEELYILDDEVRNAYDREARRGEEYVIEREISPVPHRRMVMPWSSEAESERRFRTSLLVSLLLAIVVGTLIRMLHVPVPVRPAVVVVPERLVSMLREEPRKAPPPKEEKKPEKDQEKKAPEKEEEKTPTQDEAEPTARETQVARKRAESAGVLAFKESFKDLMDEAPVSRLGAQARLNSQPAAAAGPARPGRSLLTMAAAAAGSSGGISDSAVSRTVSHANDNRIGNVALARVQSAVAAKAEEARPLSSGPGASRTDEEIQIVFDRYKATLYRMYNAELRITPTLRGKMILRITIEPGGEVSACVVQSNDVGSPELVARIVERVKRFNFGPKVGASAVSILYPIDFLPPG